MVPNGNTLSHNAQRLSALGFMLYNLAMHYKRQLEATVEYIATREEDKATSCSTADTPTRKNTRHIFQMLCSVKAQQRVAKTLRETPEMGQQP